jgi:hypothetical protein
VRWTTIASDNHGYPAGVCQIWEPLAVYGVQVFKDRQACDFHQR